MSMFEMIRRDGMARVCKLRTGHGYVETPLLMPVVNPNIQTLPMDELKGMGAQAIITNGYIIMNDPDLSQTALEKGIHAMLGWDGPIMTDSGAFQTHVYGNGINISAEGVVEFQVRIGSDICTILDLFTEPDEPEHLTREKIHVTLERARFAIEKYGNSERLISCPVQGSRYLHLREECARELSEMGATYIPIGGVVPLMEAYRFADLVDVIIASKRGISPSIPVHLFGCGHPILFPLAVLLGCDIFDSAAYVKYAKMNRILTPEGTITVDEWEYSPCGCRVCTEYTPSEIRRLPPEERVHHISYHNLYLSLMEIKRVKQAIASESLWEYTMLRCRSHPNLYEAVRRLQGYYRDMEEYEPLYRKTSVMYTGEETFYRPCVLRLMERIKERYRAPDAKLECIIDEPEKPYMSSMKKYIEKYPSVHFTVKGWMGYIPLELDSIYPVTQSVIPRWAWENKRNASGSSPVDSIQDAGSPQKKCGSKLEWNTLIARAISDIQFGSVCTDLLLKPPLEFKISKKTGRIRNIISAGEHVLSLRAEDGFATLKLPGAKRIHPTGQWRVVADRDAAEFVARGRNLFCKFVVDCDPQIRPRDEVLIVDEDDALLAVGQSVMNAREMRSFKRGVAVYVRESCGKIHRRG